ncbi:hypothetical protein L9F63_002749, partial [Diploptera punctata]
VNVLFLVYLTDETQREPPHMSTSKQTYQVGETLEANCNHQPCVTHSSCHVVSQR